jgi:parvulin-like peptidyl-prolyl isomerase
VKRRVFSGEIGMKEGKSMLARRVAIAALALAWSTAIYAQSGAGDEVVAKMGGAELKLSDVRRLLAAQTPEVRAQVLKSPELLDRMVRTEAFRRAVLADAKAKGWDKRPEAIEQMERAREQALVQSYINDVTRAPASYPSEEELKAAYQANEAEFRTPRQFRLAQIFIGAGDATKGDAAKRKAEELSRRAREKNADFAALARSESEHKPSAAAGGDMGWLAESELTPEIRNAVTALDKGDTSAPIKTAQGWHIIKVLDFKPAGVRPLSEVRDQLAGALRLRRAQENEKRYLDELASKDALVVNQIALSRLQVSKDAK